MSEPTRNDAAQESPDGELIAVLDAASPKGEDVVVRMTALPKWWHLRAPRARRRRGPGSADPGARSARPEA